MKDKDNDWKTQDVLYLRKAGAFRISNMILKVSRISKICRIIKSAKLAESRKLAKSDKSAESAVSKKSESQRVISDVIFWI